MALAALLVLIAVLVYGDHASNGGWVGDAWSTRAWYALYPHTSFFSTVGHFFDLNSSMAARPANAVYRVTLNDLFGADTGAWFAWQAASCVLMCLAVFALLREVGVRYLDAAAVAGLLAVFPASVSLWLWSPIVHASLAIALAALGFLLALRAFGREGRGRLALHTASLLLFVLSLLLYEVCLPLFLASFLLYALRAPRREACARWLVDCLVLLPLALVISSSTESRDQGLGGSIDHAAKMAGQLPELLLQRLLPFSAAPALGAIALLAIYAAAVLAIRRRPAGDPVSARLRGLFALTLGGLVVIVLGYLIYAPGIDYYLPLAEGIGDRVNAVAGIGWILCLYAAAAMTATLLTMWLRRRALAAASGTVALVIALGLSWLPPIADESRAYLDADEASDRVLNVVQRAVPDPPRGSVIWTFGQPVEAAVGVPIFANYWNMTAAIQLRYHDRHLRSFVALPGTRFACTAKGVVPGGSFEYPPPPPGKLGDFGSRYGRTYFVDTERGQFATIDSRARCLELRGAFRLSPTLPPTS
ncbi:MAG TPA: hypothetical protein VFP17_01175 [Solirubrobacterales bacterium]|nr:hypothetical protein [Solirubrobacterales bacterium]